MIKNANIKQIIFMGRKIGGAKALSYLIDKKLRIRFVVTDRDDKKNQSIIEISNKYKIPITTDTDIYLKIRNKSSEIKDVDLVISYLFWKRIKKPLIDLPKIGCINFHPAPIDEFKGRAGYNTAILDSKNKYGVTAHFIDSEEFDIGPIIRINRFAIDPLHETALSLEKRSQKELLKLYYWVINRLIQKKSFKCLRNDKGLYLNKKQFEDLKLVNLQKDSLEVINRKIRAFFYPPYDGAIIKWKGQTFTLINREILQQIDSLISYEKL